MGQGAHDQLTTHLRGRFCTDGNLLSAGSVLVAIPVLIVFSCCSVSSFPN